MNTKTGFWSAFGAIVGGAIGMTATKYAVRARSSNAMVVGGTAGAMIGAFVGGASADTAQAHDIEARLHELEASGERRLGQLVERIRS